MHFFYSTLYLSIKESQITGIDYLGKNNPALSAERLCVALLHLLDTFGLA